MKLAFCLYRYFPFGGLQRDFLNIARACLARGHEVKVYTALWEGEREPGLQLELIPVSGWQNHSRLRSFSQRLQKRLQDQNYDLVIGFNKMPGLDIYYAADVCYQARIKNQKPFWYRWLPRYHHYLDDERQVFAAPSKTKILVLSKVQRDEYRACYQLTADRFHLLPPGISRDRLAPPEAPLRREELRASFQLKPEDQVLLLVGSGFKTKGLDRVLAGMASLPLAEKIKTHLWVVGQDNSAPFLASAKELGLSAQVHFLGGRHDVAHFFLAADFLVHPAYHENTGTVLLEAIIAGLPVLTLDVCGYAHYVSEAQVGVVLSSPFDQNQFNQALLNLLLAPNCAEWKNNGLAFGKTADIYSLPEKAVDFIESQAKALPKKTFAQFMKLEGECFREQKGRRTQRVIINNQSYFIKQHFGVGWKEIFKNFFQLKLPIISAKNEVEAIKRLQNLGISTPVLSAYGYQGLNPARLQSFLLMEELCGLLSLEDFCRHWKTQPPSFSLKQALIQKVAEIAKTLHENGINHRDFYLCHFLLDPQSVKGINAQEINKELKIVLIDLHRAGLHKTLGKRWLIKDLAGLYFSSQDQGFTERDYYRFIKSYRQKSLRDIIMHEKKLWLTVEKCGERLYDAHVQSQP